MMWSIKLSPAPSDINSSSLEDILSVISQPTIFRAHKAWIFWMSSINSNYFGQGKVQRQFWHISNHQNHYFISILYQLQEDYSKQLPKIPVQNDWFHCSTILRCYPFTFLCKFTQRAERTVSPVTSAQQTPRPGIKETDRLFAICEATCAGVKSAAQAGTGGASLYF